MSFEIWLAYAVACTILLIIPGPTILIVISYSVSQGRQAIVPLTAAVALGDATALAISLLGLGALLSTSAAWFTVIKWVGGLYLLYLGIKLFRSGISPPEIEPLEMENSAAGSRRKLFANTARRILSSPKSQRRFNLTGGSLLTLAGLWALTVKQASSAS